MQDNGKVITELGLQKPRYLPRFPENPALHGAWEGKEVERGQSVLIYVPWGDSQLQTTDYNRGMPWGNAMNERRRGGQACRSYSPMFRALVLLHVKGLIIGPLVEALSGLPSELLLLHLCDHT